MNHINSVFVNSCLKLPIDPISKMPKTAFERRKTSVTEQSSIDSASTICSTPAPAFNGEDANVRSFYKSIPDYNDINHLPPEEFYSTLKSLREKKRAILGLAVEHIDDNGIDLCNKNMTKEARRLPQTAHATCTNNRSNKCISNDKFIGSKYDTQNKCENIKISSILPSATLKQPIRKTVSNKTSTNIVKDTAVDTSTTNKSRSIKNNRSKRNHSSCSITWNDMKIYNKDDVDEKFDKFFDIKTCLSPTRQIDDDFKTRSMPSSPLRTRMSASPTRKVKNLTVPKPFKMTERDEEERMVNELRSIQKSFSADALNQKYERKQFKANPVPIESRIPLYDKILEDQAMRRVITKINSEAELRAQMKPFSFTKREQNPLNGVCEKATHILPKTKKRKRFKARPVPRNLFSNYFYDKMREDQFFRNMNRQIRAEETLRTAHLPGSMAARERSRLSTPAAHSDLPIDPSPVITSCTSSDKQRPRSPTKQRKKMSSGCKEEFITTSPQPFKFSTADRAAKKMQDISKKIYQESKTTESLGGNDSVGPRAYSALDLRAAVSGRSNLAALLRAEAVRRRFEIEAVGRIAEQRRKLERKQRDRLLRSKPAWHLVKNNHEEDIAMRLQTRRDEERMRHEEFMHEMELMYGRVQQQPMLFERYYAPRSPYPLDYIQLSERKATRSPKKCKSYISPNRIRKVSINDTTETYNDGMIEYLNDKYSDFEGPTDRVQDCKK